MLEADHVQGESSSSRGKRLCNFSAVTSVRRKEVARGTLEAAERSDGERVLEFKLGAPRGGFQSSLSVLSAGVPRLALGAQGRLWLQ